MVTIKEKYEFVLNMFCDKSHPFHKEYALPFIQDGKYYATDAHCLIQLPCQEIELDFLPQEKPQVSKVLSYDRPFNRVISIESLKAVIDKFAPKIDEFRNPPRECEECEGTGEVECNYGHDHDCEECGGTGETEGKYPTGKQIPDPKSMLIIWKSNIMVDKLQKVIRACEILGYDELREISACEDANYTFQFGKFEVLIMRCMKCDGKNIYTDLV